jgi:hypothetical protein
MCAPLAKHACTLQKSDLALARWFIRGSNGLRVLSDEVSFLMESESAPIYKEYVGSNG